MNQSFHTLTRLLFTVLTVSACVYTAYTQTPVAVLENADGDTVLTSFTDGGLLVTGDYGTGTIPTEGRGTRMMWHPAKAAFRAGQITGMRWDNSQVGRHSFAFGYDTRASGEYAAAWGRTTSATGSFSTAWGNQTSATHLFSTVWGQSTEAFNEYATAWGQASKAHGYYSTAWGLATRAAGEYTTTWGRETTASGRYSTAWGRDNAASGDYATVWGQLNKASGNYSTTWGGLTEATGLMATAWGEESKALNNFTTAWGVRSNSSGNGSTAWGLQTFAGGDYSTAWGRNTQAIAFQSTAIGFGTVAANENSLSIGKYNITNTGADNTLFVIGNGSSDMNRHDAFVVDVTGNVTTAGTVNAMSDRRLKENILPLKSHALTKLAKIQPVRYTFKDQKTKPSGTQIGLIAQEVQAQFPELVKEGSNGYLSVSYGNFTAVLLKGLQEQQAQIEAQQNQLQIHQKLMEDKDRQILELQAELQRFNQLEARLTRLELQNQNSAPPSAE